MIRHITSVGNVRNGTVIDPALVKHGVVEAGRIADMSWWIDPATHLNLDIPEHLMDHAIVATRLEIGARILGNGDGFIVAPLGKGSFHHYGKVDIPEIRRRISLRPAAQV